MSRAPPVPRNVKIKETIVERMVYSFYAVDASTPRKNLCHGITFCIAATFVLSGFVGYLIVAYKNGGTFEDMSMALGLVLSGIFGFSNLLIVRVHVARLRNLQSLINTNPHMDIHQREVQERRDVIDRAFTACCILLAAIGCVLCVAAGMQSCDGKPRVYSCGYGLPNYELIDNAFYRSVVNIIDAVLIVYSVTAIFAPLALMFFVVVYLELFFKVYQSTVNEIHRLDKPKRPNALIAAYRQHVYLISIWFEVVGIIKWVALNVVVFGGLMLGFACITFFITRNFISLMHCAAYVIAMMVIGWVGERIITLGENIRAFNFYACPWDGDVRSVRFLMFMNLNARQGLALPVGDFTICTQELILSVLKFGYSVVTLYLNSVQN